MQQEPTDKRYLYKRVCKMCGSPFTTPTSNTRYCCKECRDKGRAQQRLEIEKRREVRRKEKAAEEARIKEEKKRKAERRSWGHNYAEMQKQETLRMIGSVLDER